MIIPFIKSQAHSSVEKAGLIGLVRMHYLESDYNTLGINGQTLSEALKTDRAAGNIPFWVSEVAKVNLTLLVQIF